MEKPVDIRIVHSTHLDLYWIGSQAVCLEKGAKIIDDALQIALVDESFCFFIETVRFLEYYLSRYPHHKDALLRLMDEGRFEVGAAYTDRMENMHDGESTLRNAVYGKKILRNLTGRDTIVCYHPDLPGLSEQTPQMYRKAGVKYYLFARGFKNGARFWWKALDDSRVLAYNFPIHYSYYSVENEILPNVEAIQKAIQSCELLIACSAGDLGQADTMIGRVNGKPVVLNLRKLIRTLNKSCLHHRFAMSGALSVLARMDETNLPVKWGEAPSRWGQGADASRVEMSSLDRRVSAMLYEAELYTTLCSLEGMPVSISFARHPLDNRGYAGGERQYFDLKLIPKTTAQWLEYAWRLQIVTQDHNYGGVDGLQSHFDKTVYKQAALNIAITAREAALSALTARDGAAGTRVTLWNSLNWVRSETVCLPEGLCEKGKRYMALDVCGKTLPVWEGAEGFFLQALVSPVGYETLQIVQGEAKEQFSAVCVWENEEKIHAENAFFALCVNKRTGTVQSLYDRKLGMELTSGTDMLAVYVISDTSSGVDESAEGKELLDDSRCHVHAAYVRSSDMHALCIRVESEICKNKLCIDVTLDHKTGQMHIEPKIFWNGLRSLQVKMALPVGVHIGELRYGVAYGQQLHGKYIEEPDFIATDEIDPRLYQRYRKVIGWYAFSDDERGMAMILEHGTMDFHGDRTQVTLIRNTRNCGDWDVHNINEGSHAWKFTLQTFAGTLEQFNPSRHAYERLHPVMARIPEKVREGCSAQRTYVDTRETGIVTALYEDPDSGQVRLRLFNETDREKPLRLRFDVPVSGVRAIDLLGGKEDSSVNKLGPFEIKTLALKVSKQNRRRQNT